MTETENELQLHVEKLLKNLHVHEYTIEMSSASSAGNNFMAIVDKIDVQGKNADGEDTDLHFVVKKAQTNETFRKVHATKSVYLREVFTYEKILPIFVELQKSYEVPTLFESYPVYHGSCTIDFKEFIVMENMKALGFQNCDKQNSFDLNHALLVIKELGRLHALSFALKRKNKEAFREICHNCRDIEYQPGFEVTSQQVIDILCIFALKSLDPLDDREAFDKFYHFRKKILNTTIAVLDEVFDSEHGVIVHGDCWIGNLLFKYQPQTKKVPSDVCMLDWQFLRVGSPAFDISQLLFLCCDKELRNAHYKDLLQSYYASFSSFLRFFGEDPSDLFPYDVLLEHLKKYSVLGLSTALRAMYLTSISSEATPDASNIKDMQEGINLYLNAKRDVIMYNKAIRGIILDYINFGYDM